jgi:hypothetical protein
MRRFWGNAMVIRTVSRTVTFRHPFRLSGIVEEQPAGTYVVETDEEPVDTPSVEAWRRISTLIRLPGRPGRLTLDQVIDIDPAELAAALERDGASSF